MSEHDKAGMLRLLRMIPAAAAQKMVGMYRDTLSGQVVELQQALAGGEDERATALAHKIAGSSAMMQDSGLSHVARAMEHALREGRMEEAARGMPALSAHAGTTLAALDEAFPG